MKDNGKWMNGDSVLLDLTSNGNELIMVVIQCMPTVSYDTDMQLLNLTLIH